MVAKGVVKSPDTGFFLVFFFWFFFFLVFFFGFFFFGVFFFWGGGHVFGSCFFVFKMN